MFILRLLSRLPLSFLYLISDFLFVVSYHLVRYRRRLVRSNLAVSFPEKSSQELSTIEKQFYRNLCDYAVETLKLLTIEEAELKKRMVYEDVSVIEEYKQNNQSVVMLASHSFNWEWLLAAGKLNLPVDIDFVYQPQSSELFNRFSLAIRTRFGAYPIKRRNVGKEAFRRRNMLRGIAIIADQYPGHKFDKKYLVNFLNRETAFFYGAAQLAEAMKYPVVFGDIRKVSRGYYELVFRKISDGTNADATVDSYAKLLEESIKRNPDGWLWSHNRWKKRHESQPAKVITKEG